MYLLVPVVSMSVVKSASPWSVSFDSAPYKAPCIVGSFHFLKDKARGYYGFFHQWKKNEAEYELGWAHAEVEKKIKRNVIIY